jgi:hypothetical protein
MTNQIGLVDQVVVEDSQRTGHVGFGLLVAVARTYNVGIEYVEEQILQSVSYVGEGSIYRHHQFQTVSNGTV